MKKKFGYTAVIRTLGTAHEKYQQLLNSLNSQTIKPDKILVYIAEGYAIPKETIGWEQYIVVKKGMVAQRALQYEEVESEYILFLDDDLSIAEDCVETMFALLQREGADVISPDIFSHANRPFRAEILPFLSGRMVARWHDDYWGYKVMRNSGFSYNASPVKDVYWSQTNAGASFLCRKKDFLNIHFEDELWMDRLKYAWGDDQVMYYKMYLSGLKQLTWYKHGFTHLNAEAAMISEEKEMWLIYSIFWFKTVFWHRFIYLPDKLIFSKLWSLLCIGYTLGFAFAMPLLKLNMKQFKLRYRAMNDAICFIKSGDYKKIPLIKEFVK